MAKQYLTASELKARQAKGDSFNFNVSQHSEFPEGAKNFLRSKGFGIYWNSACLWYDCDFKGEK